MLESIRRNQQSWLTYLIFSAIIVVFVVNFGPGSSGCQGLAGTNAAASVDGEVIRAQDFQQRYSRRLEMLRRRAQGFNITPELAEKMGLKNEIIDQLIDQKLLAHEAQRRGLEVSDEELLAYLEANYGVDQVTPEQYRNWVSYNFNVSTRQFEEDVRNELRAQKLAQAVSDNVSVSDAELKKSFLRERDRAQFHFVKFDTQATTVPTPSEAEIQKLIAEDPKAIEDRYGADTFKYRTPEQRKVRQIVKALPRDASAAEVEEAKAALEAAKTQIDGGADFAAIASSQSDDPSKTQGGDMGWVRRGQLARELEEAIFALGVGEVTKEPLRSPMGLHLIKVDEVKPPEKKALDEVKREVAISILRDRAVEDVTRAKAERLLADLKAGKSLEALTVSEEDDEPKDATDKKATDKPVRYESPWVLKSQETLPRIGIAKEMHAALFAATKEAAVLPEVYKVGRSYYVGVLKERETPDLTKFESEKEELRSQALYEKRSRVLKDWLAHLRSQAEVVLNTDLFPASKQES